MWSLEEQLILNCLRSASQPKLTQWIQNKPIDWDVFVQQCTRHAVSGLIYAYSQQQEFQNIFPPHVNNFLRKIYYKNIVQNMLLAKERQKILSPLRKRGVNPLFVQGMALLLGQIYSSPGTRRLTDLDFVVEPTQLEIVKETLGELGYSSLPFYPTLMSNGMIKLDIHTDVANVERIGARKYAVNISNNCLWQDALLQEDSSGTAYTLSPEDLIVTSAAHLQKHSYSRLIWFVDILKLIERYGEQLDWQKILIKAKEFNVQKPLYFTFNFLQNVLHYELPAAGPSEFMEQKLNIVEQKLLDGLLTGYKLSCVGDLLYFFSIKGFSRKILFLTETIFPKREVMAQIFGFSNPLALSCCYPIRFFQSVWYGIKLLLSSMGNLHFRAGAR